MTEFLTTISTFLQKTKDTVLSILKVLLARYLPYKLPKASKSYATILGNGPSLSQSLINDLEFIKESEIFCVNHFAVSTIYAEIKPQNYVLLDPAFFINNCHSAFYEVVNKMTDNFIEKTSWPVNLYIPKSAKNSEFHTKILKNPHIKTIFFNYTIIKGFDPFMFWLFRKKVGFIQSQTVLIAATFLAVNQRYKKVILFGADSSWHESINLSENNVLKMKQFHFYDNPDEVKSLEVLDIRNKNPKTSIAFQFESLSKTFKGYEVLNKFANSLGVKIYNASTKSYIDAFERIKIN